MGDEPPASRRQPRITLLSDPEMQFLFRCPPPEPMIRLLMILLTLLPLVGATPARAQQPRALEHVPPNPGNTSAEQWVWEQAQKGEIADLREYCQQQTCGAIG